MPVIALEELPELLRGNATLAGLDLGTKTIGYAISDGLRKFAHPRPVIRRAKKFGDDAQVLLQRLNEDGAVAAVIGLPVNMDGSEGPRAQATRAFVRNFGRFSDIPFVFWDERLSTVAAGRTLMEMDVSRAKRRERIDSAAAAFILQGVLDRLQLLSAGDSST